ncbi:MAG: hypothetical protein JWL77_1193 [Chthonomonadaceae bacterium]|nr:hypothetical protein [Chthonomonadaceae bacterium]
MMKTVLFLLLMLAGVATMTQAQSGAVPLRITDRNIHDMTLRALPDGEYEIRTTGSDPYAFTENLPVAFDTKRNHVLAFEFFSTTGTDHFQVFVLPPVSEDRSIKAAGLANSEGWSAYALDLQSLFEKPGGKVEELRLDFGGFAGKTIRLRNLRLREQTPQEAQLAVRREAQREAERLRDVRLRTYLHHSYPCRVTKVTLNATSGLPDGERGGSLYVEGELPNAYAEDACLVEVPIYADITDAQHFPTVLPLIAERNGHFLVSMNRQRKASSGTFDRLLSRWAVAKRVGDTFTLLSHARYLDNIQPLYNLPEEKPRNKKGIGGFTTGWPISDVTDLDLSACTVNIVLNSLFATTPGPGRSAFPYAGRTWYSEDRNIAALDRTLQATAAHHLVVSAIILLGQGGNAPPDSFSHRVAHPDADPSGIYVMPNVTSEDGLAAYAAALDYLAQRYSRPDAKYGRIHYWIMHNEVNAGWIWTNAGDKTPLLYTDLYHRSMRVAQLIARQYDAHSKAFISLEHHWNIRPTHIYAGREVLEDLLDLSAAEGDFDWAIAFHPYPQNLFDPRVWADNEATFTFDTPKITYKNLEVLDAWVKQPRARFQGKTLRTVHLTEQGLNSMDYTEKSLTDQAAGMAYAWNKYKDLETIEVFDYHNWVDNRGEGGLRIGLRRFPNDKDDPLGKKPIWYVYQALSTAKEAEATAFAKPIIGITDWSEVRYHGAIPRK